MDMNENGYTLLTADYPDFAVQKTTPKTKKTLAVLPSEGKCFILSEKGGVRAVEELNELNYAEFTSGMPDIPLPNGFWLKSVPKGKTGVRTLLSVFDDDIVLDAVCNKCCDTANDVYSIFIDRWTTESFHSLYSHNKNLLVALRRTGDEKAYYAVCKNGNLAYAITCLFGLENAIDFFRKFSVSLLCRLACHNMIIMNPISYVKRDIFEWEDKADQIKDMDYCAWLDIPFIDMDYEKFRDFILYESICFGALKGIDRFFCEWLNVLDRQVLIYGKIKEIFPKDFPSMQKRLDSIYTYFCKSGEITGKVPDVYNGSDGDYVYTIPNTDMELCTDAVEQRSIVSTCFDAFRNGDCIVLFMRSIKSPDVPYITAEIKDGELIAAKRPLNKELSVEEHDRLLSWIAEHTG